MKRYIAMGVSGRVVSDEGAFGGMTHWSGPQSISVDNILLANDFEKKFLEIIHKTNGKANNNICAELTLAGVNSKTIELVAEALSHTDYYTKDETSTSSGVLEQYRIRRKNPRQRRKDRHSMISSVDRNQHIPYKDTLYGRFFDKYYGEGFFDIPSSQLEWGDARRNIRHFHTGHTLNYGDERDNRDFKKWAFAFMKFKDFNEDKRTCIIENPVTKALVARRSYSRQVPTGSELRRENYTDEQYLTTQAEVYYEELYQLANTDIAESHNLGEDNLERTELHRTLSEVAYKNKLVKNYEMVSLLEVVQLSLSEMGIVVFLPYSSRIEHKTVRKGLKRLLNKINSVYRVYSALQNKGFSAVAARDTVILQLEDWIAHSGNVPTAWKVLKRTDWTPPENGNKPKTKKTTTGKTTASKHKKVATVDDLKAILGGQDESKE